MITLAIWNLSDQHLIWGTNVLLQVTLVAAVALSIPAVVRRSPPARYAVLCSSLWLVLMIPVIALVMQSSGKSLISVPLTHQASEHQSDAMVHALTSVAATRTRSAPDDVGHATNPGYGVTADPFIGMIADGAGAADVTDAGSGLVSEVTTSPPSSGTPYPQDAPDEFVSVREQSSTWIGTAVRDVMPPLMFIWLAGAVFLLVRLGIGWCRLMAILRSAQPNTNDLLAVSFSKIGRTLQVTRMPQLLLSDCVSGPIATGFFQPRIILPASIVDQVGTEQMRDLLVHELAHVVRRDQFIVLMQNSASAIFWLHPLVNVLNRQLAQAREEVCDNYVLTTTDAPSYGRTLLELAQLIQRAAPLPGTSGLFTSRWKLELRVASLLDERRSRRTCLAAEGKALVVTLSLGLATVASLGTMTPAVGRPVPSALIAVDRSDPRTTSDLDTEVSASAPDPLHTANAVEWPSGDPEKSLPGLIPAPADIPGLGRWQAMMRPVGGYVEAVVFSPDGKSVAFGDGRYIRIHDTITLDLIGVLVGHSGNVRALDWSPNGEWVASGGDDSSVRIWGVHGTPIAVLDGHSASVRSVAWHPQNQSLATAGMDGTIRFWGFDGTPGVVISGHETPINSVDWSPDGRLLAAGDQNHTVRLWRPDGRPWLLLGGHDGAITRVRWSPDGSWLASSCTGGAIPNRPGLQSPTRTHLWRRNGTPGPVLLNHTKEIRAVAWSPDSKQLVTGAEDRRILLWSVEGKLIRQLDQNALDHGVVFALDWNAENNRIVAGGRFSVRFLNQEGPTGSRKLIRPEGGKLMFADWHPSRDQVAFGVHDSTIRIWTGGFEKELTIDAHDYFVGCVKWSPDGRQLASMSFDDKVRLWDEEGNFLKEFRRSRGIGRGFAWTPDGMHLAVSRRDAPVEIFGMDGSVAAFDLHKGGVSGLSFCPDGTQLATGGLDAEVRVLQVDDFVQQPIELALMQASDGDVDSVAWSPDGRWIASGHNTSLRFWRPDGTAGPAVQASEAAIMRIDWSPESQRVVTGSWDTSVRLWNTDGDLVREFPSHAAPCWGASFSPDGKQLATCGWDGVARILDVETGEVLAMAIYVTRPESVPNARRLPLHHAIAFNRAGQVISGDPEILEQQLVYLVEQPSGAVAVLTPSAFHAKASGAILASHK